jgi:hypothetical protein
MRRTVYSRALARAAQILGGTEELRCFLNVPKSLLNLWLGGHIMPPDDVFLRVVDLLGEYQLQEIRQDVGEQRT